MRKQTRKACTVITRSLLACLMIAALVLTGCQPAATGTDAEPVQNTTDASGYGAEEAALMAAAPAADSTAVQTETTSTGTRQTIYVDEYYDDIYVSRPEVSATSKSPQKTMQNLSNYYFDEQAYDGKTVKGGSVKRTETYFRGIGGNQLTADGGYGTLNAFQEATDQAYFDELNITSKRSWDLGWTEEGLVKDPYSHCTGSGFTTHMAQSTYEDGTPACARFGGANAKAEAIAGIKEHQVDRLKTAKNLVCALLGNEFLYIGINPTTGRYESTGWDPDTQEQFHKWLKKRFGTIKNFNEKCDCDCISFNDVTPNTSTNARFEFFLFSRYTFYETGKAAVEYSKSQNPNIRYGYAAYCSYNCAFGNDAYLDFLDYNTSNLYKQAWWDGATSPYAAFCYQIDNLAAVSDKPVLLTEMGFTNGFTAESEADAARSYLQTLPLCYMRPQVGGTYVYEFMETFDPSNIYSTWGLVRCADRSTVKAFDAVAECYGNFKYMDEFWNGASSTPLVALTNKFCDRQVLGGSSGGGADNATATISQVLYTNGIGVRALLNDGAKRVKNLDTDKIILTDDLLYQKPDGSDDVASALADFMNDGGKILRFSSIVPETLYGEGNVMSGNSINDLVERFDGQFQYSRGTTGSMGGCADLWKTLAPFIHGDFMKGKVKTDGKAVNENAVRLLEVKAKSDTIFVASDPTWKLESQLVYKNGHMYLCIVNTGSEPVDEITVTLGVNNGVKCNLHPQVLCCNGNVTTAKPNRIQYPTWVKNTKQSKITYGAFTVKNLSTYAFIDVGMAIVAD